MSFDYTEHTKNEIAAIKEKLSALALEQKKAEALVAKKEKELEDAIAELNIIAKVQLPELMESLGSRKFTTKEGIEISLGEDIRANIPVSSSGEAFSWLEKEGHGNLIKREFKVLFGKEEEEWAKEFEQLIAQSDMNLNVQVKRTVHPSTLSAFVREQLSGGNEIPLDLLGVSRQRQTKIKIKG
jgi:hypothetical protein